MNITKHRLLGLSAVALAFAFSRFVSHTARMAEHKSSLAMPQLGFGKNTQTHAQVCYAYCYYRYGSPVRFVFRIISGDHH